MTQPTRCSRRSKKRRLKATASWDKWRAHYATDDADVDMKRIGEDLKTFPPIAARIAELTADRAAEEQRQQQ